MAKVEVLINGESLELDKSGDIVGTYAVNKLGDIATRQGNYTNTFRAPVASSKNKAIAENAQQILSQSNIPYSRQTAEIRVDGAQVVLGDAQLKSAKDFFRWVVKSGNSDLFNRIKGLSLRDLDLSDYDHLWTASNVYASRNNTYVDGYIYPDIDYGLFGSEGSATQVYSRFFPAVFDYVILQAIIEDAGFTVSGDFLENELFRKKITPFVGVDLLHSSEWVTLKSFRAKMGTQILSISGTKQYWFGFDNDSTDGYFDNDNQFTLGGWINSLTPLAVFINNEPMYSYFESEVTFTITSWTNGLSSFWFSISYFVGGGGGNELYTHTDALGAGTFTVKIYGSGLLPGFVAIESELKDIGITFSSGYLSNIPQLEVVALSTIDISTALPDIKQSDFLLTLANQFALFFQTNNLTNNIKIFQLNDIIEKVGVAKDWRSKVDLSERTEKTFLFEDYAQTNVFTYLTDKEDAYLSLDPLYGQGVIEVENAFLPDKKDLFKSVFAPIKRIASFTNAVTIAYIPKYDADGENTINAVPRNCYVEVTNTSNLLQITGQPTRTTSPAVYFTDLEFENLITQYYEPLVRLLNKAKVVTALVRLNVSDINQLDFEYPVLFTVDGEDGYFYINEIKQFKFNSRESTEVELVMLRP